MQLVSTSWLLLLLTPALLILPTAPVAAPAAETGPGSTTPGRQGKRPLEHKDAEHWKSIREQVVGRRGKFVAFAINPQVGDGLLYWRDLDAGRTFKYGRGTGPAFTHDEDFLVFLIEPSYAEKRKFKLEQLKKGGTSGSEKGASGSGASRGRPGRDEDFLQRRRRGRRGGQAGSKASRKGPKLDLRAVRLADQSVVKALRNIKSFKLPEAGPAVLAYMLEEMPKKKGKKKGKKKAKKKATKKGAGKGDRSQEVAAKGEDDDADKASAAKGNTLVLFDLGSGKELMRIKSVSTYSFPAKRQALYYVQEAKDKSQRGGLFAIDLSGDLSGDLSKLASPVTVHEGPGVFKSITVDREARRLAYLFQKADLPKPKKPKAPASKEVAAGAIAKAAKSVSTSQKGPKKKPKIDPKKEPYALYLWDWQAERAKLVAKAGKSKGLFPGYRVSPDTRLRFSRDASKLLFGMAKPLLDDIPPQLKEDKVTLDLWHYKDPLIQPMQAKRASQERKRAITHVMDIEADRIIHLGDEYLEQPRFLGKSGDIMLASRSRPYKRLLSWDGSYADYYIYKTKDARGSMVMRKFAGRPSPSDSGRYLAYFDRNKQWHLIDNESGKDTNLSQGIAVSFAREDWDKPAKASSYGLAGWSTDDRFVFIYDRYDIWRFATDGSSQTCITEGFGRDEYLSFRIVQTDPDAFGLDMSKPVLLRTTHTETMSSGFYKCRLDEEGEPMRLVFQKRSFGRRLTKAKDGERLFFRRSTFHEFGDLWTAGKDFTNMKRISDANPQQRKILWGRGEIVRWRSNDGRRIKGALYKPENFDPQKKYPMIVYTYEKRSQNLHSYRSPLPGTSPSASYYVSNGYLWFEPDIHYKVGHTGQSAYDCVIPGVLHLIDKGYVDEKAIGIAGHSFGGYQSAYLVTRTKLFKAAESGAPVSNMTSAYGGVRWSSGMSRAFQYEKTQSRIGGTLWDLPENYIENSPIFKADQVTTPVLMLHNDKDGAVPWYQGIEFFLALRRLGREVYLFNYVGEAHGLRRRANKVDWTRRMQEFFDHHLKGRPAPEWMRKGIPYIAREREKLRYIEKKATAVPASIKTPKTPPGTVGNGQK